MFINCANLHNVFELKRIKTHVNQMATEMNECGRGWSAGIKRNQGVKVVKRMQMDR